MKMGQYDKFLKFLERLEKARITYDLEHSREDALMVRVVVPGEYWEVEFLRDGEIEVERYRSNGHIYGKEMLDHLFAWYSVDSPEATPEQVRRHTEEFFEHVALPAREIPVSATNGPATQAVSQHDATR